MHKTYRIAVVGIGIAMMPWLASMPLAALPKPAQQPMSASEKPAVTSTVPVEDQATKEQLARLFEVMRLKDQMQSVMKMLPAMMQQQVQAQVQEMTAKLPNSAAMTPEEQAAITKLTDKYMKKAMTIINVDQLIDDMTVLYQRHLSRSDVEAFIAFYNSTPGQHLLDEQPAIMKEYMPMVMQQTQERSKALMDEMMKDMQDTIKQSAPAASTSPQN